VPGRPGALRSQVSSDLAIIGDRVFVPNVAPVDLQDDKVPLGDNIEFQTRQVFANLGLLVAPLGLGLKDVVQVTAYLLNYERYLERFDNIYRMQFPTDPLPIRTCIGASGLTRGAQVTIDFVLFAGAA